MTTMLRLAWEKVRAVLVGNRLDREFEDELASHIEFAVEDARRRGLDPEQARREALRRLGGMQRTRDVHRDTRGLPLIDALVQDLSYGVRTLRRTPVFTLVVVASLALGIGANTAVFTIINAVLLRTLPVPDPDELVRLSARPVLSFAMYQDLRRRQQVFTDILATTREWQVRLTIPGPTGTSTLDNVPTSFVSVNYFNVLLVRPQVGRFFVDEDDGRPQGAETEGSVAVISDGLWERQFARDPAVIGRIIHVNSSACRLIGVAPRGFAGDSVGVAVDLWVPVIPFSPRNYLEGRGGQFTQSIARLKPGVTPTQARDAMTTLFKELRQAEWNAYPDTRRRTTLADAAIAVVPVSTGLDNGLRWKFSTPLWIIMAIVAAVLLIACANVANLLLARSAWRRGEFSVRLALGCGRSRLMRQLLTESLLLASLGTLAGLGLAYWGTRALAAMADAGRLDLSPDFSVLAFVVGITIFTGLGFGIAPAIGGTRADLSLALTQQGRAGAGRQTRQALSRTLVLIQVALSLALLIGAGLLVRSIYNLGHVDLGFRPTQVLVFDVAHNLRAGATPAAVARLAQDVHERVRQVPGVESASLSTIPLFSDTDLYVSLRIPGHPFRPDAPIDARFNSVSPGYMETLGMTLIEGRTIQEQDTGNELVAVINQTMARRYFPQGSAVGRTMEISTAALAGRPIQIVGVVRDAKYNDVRAETKPMFFRPIQQFPGRIRAIEVRTSAPASAVIASIRQVLLEVGQDLMVREVIPLSAQVGRTLAAERLIGRLSIAFGGIALLLAAIGLYGVLSYGVAQRTGEIGIRMALGATRGDVLSLVVRQSLLVVTGGAAVGFLLAFAGARFIRTFLYGLTPTDAGTLLGATAVLLGAAAIADYIPARRAAHVDPAVALRHH
jgi:predicted permease